MSRKRFLILYYNNSKKDKQTAFFDEPAVLFKILNGTKRFKLYAKIVIFIITIVVCIQLHENIFTVCFCYVFIKLRRK